MTNNEIITIKDNNILSTVGENCEKIFYFGSFAYGTQKDGSENPILILQDIYKGFAQNPNYKAVDILANSKNHFEARSNLPTIEHTIAEKGVVLYDRE